MSQRFISCTGRAGRLNGTVLKLQDCLQEGWPHLKTFGQRFLTAIATVPAECRWISCAICVWSQDQS